MENEKIGRNEKLEKKSLGRGFAALFGDTEEAPVSTSGTLTEKNFDEPTDASSLKIQNLPIDQISANPDQPRQTFADDELLELAESISEQGLIQPILVRMLDGQNYQIIAGERRYRASKLAGLTEIPSIIRGQDIKIDQNDLASVIENIQRVDLNAIELSNAYSKILANHGYTQDALAKKLGVSRTAIANTLRLQKLPGDVKNLVSQNKISEGHARALLPLEKEDEIRLVANEAVERNYSVRDVESLVREKLGGSPANSGSMKIQQTANERKTEEVVAKDPSILATEEELRSIFGTKVLVRGNTNGGTIEIYYSGSDSMHRLLHQLRSVSK